MRIEKPRRATRRYIQHLVAPGARVAPLLCPVREADWIEGWDPALVVSVSGAVEDDCVFVTGSGRDEAVWCVTRHDAKAGQVEMVKITPGVTACRLAIALRDVPGGCEAEVTYSHTSLGPAGDAFVAGFTEAHYEKFMQDWERRLNHYLATGKRLPA